MGTSATFHACRRPLTCLYGEDVGVRAKQLDKQVSAEQHQGCWVQLCHDGPVGTEERLRASCVHGNHKSAKTSYEYTHWTQTPVRQSTVPNDTIVGDPNYFVPMQRQLTVLYA